MKFPEHIQTWKHNKSVNDDTMRQMIEISPQKIIDFGAGDGFYSKLLKYLFSTCYVVGVEAESSYPKKFGLYDLYDELIIDRLENFIDRLNINDYDLAVFGDVIEHLEKSIAEEVIKKAVNLFPYIIINSPIGFQDNEVLAGAVGVESELHRCGIDRSFFDSYEVLEWHVYDNDIMFNCLLKGN